MIRFVILLMIFSGSSWAGKQLIVESGLKQTALVELYTSEGCSSCPPADKWLETLIDIPKDELDTLALAFHVDYWDYIGWKDPYASASYTQRQRNLGRINLQRSIYTPEFFVDGQEARGTRNVISQIKQSNDQDASIKLKLIIEKVQQELKLNLLISGDLDETMNQFRFIIYENGLSSDIDAGENSGRILRHQRVVRYMSPAMPVEQMAQLDIEIDPKWKVENIGVVAWVFDPDRQATQQLVYSDISSLLEP